MYADADGYYEIHPNGEDGDAVTVYCDLTLGADYYICDDCNDFHSYDDATGCPSGMEPIIPRSREHWARSVPFVVKYGL